MKLQVGFEFSKININLNEMFKLNMNLNKNVIVIVDEIVEKNVVVNKTVIVNTSVIVTAILKAMANVSLVDRLLQVNINLFFVNVFGNMKLQTIDKRKCFNKRRAIT